MTVFLLAAAGLVLLALALLLPALLRRRGGDQASTAAVVDARRANLAILAEQRRQLDAELAAGQIDVAAHRAQLEEIERRVLDEEAVDEAPQRTGTGRKTAWATALAVPLLALGGYAAFGNFAALDPAARHAQAGGEGEVTLAQIEEMVDKLAKRLETQPAPGNDDLEGWTMLARSYTAMQRFEEADRAFQRAIAMAPGDAQLLADRADVLGALQGQKLAGEPMRLIEQALKIDPKHPKALALAGAAAYELGDFDGAARRWTQAREAVPADSDFARGLEASITEARTAARQHAAGASAAAGGGAATAPVAAAAAPANAGATPGTPAQAGAAKVVGRVSLAPALAAKAAPGDTVFVYARAAEGPRAPLAVLRRTVADLPFEFTLDDSMAMSPQFRLSNFPRVVVGARVSKSGQALPQSGDLQGQSAPLALGGAPVEIVIDGVQP